MTRIIENGTPLKVVVHVDREAAILAGRNRWGDHVVELDPAELTEQQRQTLAACPEDYERKLLKLSPSGCKLQDAGTTSIQMALDSIYQAKQARVAEEAARNAKNQAEAVDKYRQAAELPFDECLDEQYDRFRDLTGYKWWTPSRKFRDLLSPCFWSSPKIPWEQTEYADAIKARQAEIEVEISKRNEQLYQERLIQVEQAKRESEEKVAAGIAKERRRTAQVSAWVQDHGTENQKARLAAGVLPEDEIKQEIRDSAFESLDRNFERYSRMTPKDVCECHGYGPCKVTFETYEAASMTADQWEQVDTIRKLAPAAKVVLRIHEGKGTECEATKLKYSVLVTMDVGEFTFSREYSATETPEDDE
jgi:hypothetical protein